jgi:cell division protein ZapD
LIIYDYPLQERIRTLLRLEDLFARIAFFSERSLGIDHHAALLSLFEILEVAARADLKTDMIQELERQKIALEVFRNNPGISEASLDGVLAQIADVLVRLYDMSGKTGQHLRDNEWLMSIKQRTTIPGGVCEFDLPSYHFWLSMAPEVRQQSIGEWLRPFLPLRDGLAIVLKLLRESGRSSRELAAQGSYQQMLAGAKPMQLLRVAVEPGLPCFPEISANKYAINIRFTVLGGAQKPRTWESDVPFQLTLCTL